MTMYYSKSTCGFYDSLICGEQLPSDAIEITADQHASLMQAQSTGKIIQADANGNPVAVTPVVTAQQIHAALVDSAQAAIDKSDTTILRCYSAGIAVPAAWQSYRAALRSIINGSDTSSTVLPSVPAYPSGT